MDQVTQQQINKAAWGACDTFRGVVDLLIYMDYVLTMLFPNYISDVWADHRAHYQTEHPDSPKLVEALMRQEAFVLLSTAEQKRANVAQKSANLGIGNGWWDMVRTPWHARSPSSWRMPGHV